MLVLRLSRRGRRRRLLAVAVLRTARTLRGVGAFAAVHAPVVVGIGAAIGLGAMTLMLAVTALRALAVLGMGAVAVMLGMALLGAMTLVLGVVAMIVLRRSGGLRQGGSDESEGRRGGDENGLHVMIS